MMKLKFEVRRKIYVKILIMHNSLEISAKQSFVIYIILS